MGELRKEGQGNYYGGKQWVREWVNEWVSERMNEWVSSGRKSKSSIVIHFTQYVLLTPHSLNHWQRDGVLFIEDKIATPHNFRVNNDDDDVVMSYDLRNNLLFDMTTLVDPFEEYKRRWVVIELVGELIIDLLLHYWLIYYSLTN